jgi:hypothetical protein
MLSDTPLPDITTPIAKEIIELVRRLNESTKSEVSSQLANTLEIKVAQAFNVDPVFNLD